MDQPGNRAGGGLPASLGSAAKPGPRRDEQRAGSGDGGEAGP
jgi:hypothetical protein